MQYPLHMKVSFKSSFLCESNSTRFETEATEKKKERIIAGQREVTFSSFHKFVTPCQRLVKFLQGWVILHNNSCNRQKIMHKKNENNEAICNSTGCKRPFCYCRPSKLNFCACLDQSGVSLPYGVYPGCQRVFFSFSRLRRQKKTLWHPGYTAFQRAG